MLSKERSIYVDVVSDPVSQNIHMNQKENIQ